MMTKKIFLVILALSLAACGQAPQVPTDRYYRLTLQPGSMDKLRLTADPIYVQDFVAEGLYNDRALLYSEDETATELQQQHYHFWYTAPPHMLRDYLLQVLRNADVSPVVTDAGMQGYLRISGELLEFERRQTRSGPVVNVALELRLTKPGVDLPLLLKQYHASEAVSNTDAATVVSGFNAAVDGMYREFLGDLKTALQAPSAGL